MHLKFFNLKLENILNSVLKFEVPSSEVVAKAVVALKVLVDEALSQTPEGDDPFAFINGYKQLIDAIYAKLEAKLENGELRAGETISSGAVNYVRANFAEFAEFINVDRNLLETHNEAVETAKKTGTAPCSICTLKSVTCAGIDEFKARDGVEQER